MDIQSKLIILLYSLFIMNMIMLYTSLLWAYKDLSLKDFNFHQMAEK